MAFKRLFVDIKGDVFDTWNIISAEAEEEYNDVTGEFDYLLKILKNSVNKEAEQKVYRFTDEDERDNLLIEIKAKLKQNPNIFFLGEDDGSMNDDELAQAGFQRGKQVETKKSKQPPDQDFEED